MLDRYWPGPDQVNDCIKNEAETADVAVLLAVHQPSQFTTKNAGTNIVATASEQDLLDAFLSEDVPGGYLLFPITGPSGFGKSHTIRWLDAQLQRSAKRDRLHIIRIPKSASLRKVVELVLEPLASDPRFEKPRADLTRAISEVDKREAVVRFRAEIENALKSRESELLLEARQHSDRAVGLRAIIGHARGLPTLLNDAAVKNHFDDTVLTRVVARALQGLDERSDAAENQAEFSPDDLIIPDSVNINEAALTVKTYYQTQLAIQDEKHRRDAADLLNSVLDTAIANVFQLQQSMGGTTLQEIILSIREILLKDDIDLVLLVEDFAALAGIQDLLLKVCIQEGTYGGQKVRATMRTALALTDGYLASRDTILTRAQRVWVIGNHDQSDSEIKEAVADMVGAYLNAARWGAKGLRRRFDLLGAGSELDDWLPAWRNEEETDSESNLLTAFGFSSRGHALFPFNRLAIGQLTELHLVEGNRLQLNPRRIINEILRRTLLLRPAFLNNIFPTPNFQGLRPNAYLASLIRDASQPPDVKARLGSVLAIWGGNASEQMALESVPPEIFTTFSLPTPAQFAQVAFVPHQPVGTPQEPSRTALESLPALKQDSKVVEWAAKLEAWASGAELVHVDARELRKALAVMLKGAINWPALRIPSQEIQPSWLAIAKARGNPQGGRVLVVCDDYTDKDASLREGFLGALRFGYNGSGWDYAEADVDYVASAAIIDRLVAQLVPMLIADAKAQASAIGRTLLTQSRLIGLSPPIRPTSPGALLRGLFSPPPPSQVNAQAPDNGLSELKTHALGLSNGRDLRKQLQNLLLDRTASYQSMGEKPFAVDTPRLIDVLSGDALTGALPEGLPEEISAFIPTMREARLEIRIKPVVEKLRSFHTDIADFIEDGLDKHAFVADLHGIIPLLQKTACWPIGSPVKLGEFENSLSEFQTSAFVKLVEEAATIVEDAEKKHTPRLLNALGTIDLGLIERTVSFLKTANEIITLAEKNVVAQEAVRGQSDPSVGAATILSLLEGISDPQTGMEIKS